LLTGSCGSVWTFEIGLEGETASEIGPLFPPVAMQVGIGPQQEYGWNDDD